MMSVSSVMFTPDRLRLIGSRSRPAYAARSLQWTRHHRLVLRPAVPARPMPRPPADPGRRSDADLVMACRQGDARAWRELVDRYRRLVYGIPRSVGLQPADADEIFQHTFAELLRSLPRLHDPGRIEAWLVTTAHRASLRLRRAERRRIRLQETAARGWPAGDAPPEVALDRLREGERLRRVVDSLGEPCRGLILGLFSDPARPYQVLARELGVAIGSIGAMRARCLERLRRRFIRERLGAPLAGHLPLGGRR